MQTLTFSLKLYNFGPQNLRWIFLLVMCRNTDRNSGKYALQPIRMFVTVKRYKNFCSVSNVVHGPPVEKLFHFECKIPSGFDSSLKFPPKNGMDCFAFIQTYNFHKSLHPFSELHCFLSAFLFKLGPLYDSLVTSRFHCKKQFKTSIP